MKTIIAVFLLLVSSALFAQTNDHPAQVPTQTPSMETTPTSTETATAKPSIDPAKEADIQRLLEVTGAKALAIQRMASMENNLRPMLVNSFPPGEYRDKLIQLFFDKFHSKVDQETLVGLVIPVYDKYLSDEEVKGMIQFYSTPLGKKMIEVLPKLMAESEEAGQQWGAQIGRQSMIEVLQEHPDLRQALENANKPALPQP